MVKLHTNWLGGALIERDGEYYLIQDGVVRNDNPVTKEIMERFLKQYHGINVINRPGECFLFEVILEKPNHGVEMQTADIADIHTLGLKWKILK